MAGNKVAPSGHVVKDYYKASLFEYMGIVGWVVLSLKWGRNDQMSCIKRVAKFLSPFNKNINGLRPQQISENDAFTAVANVSEKANRSYNPSDTNKIVK